MINPIRIINTEECYTNLAIDIIDAFEQLLEDNNMTIPDEAREDINIEARIFGYTYYELEDYIKEYLQQNVNIKKYR